MAEYITMKQVPGGIVTAKDDRIINDANLADCGLIYGCEISYIGNNMIHINAGYGIIKGGLFEMEDHTEYVDYSISGQTKGQIYLKLDLSANDKLTIVKETTNSLHQMRQDDNANFENGIYEMQLCTFTATTSTLIDVVQTAHFVELGVIDDMIGIFYNDTPGIKAGALAVKSLWQYADQIYSMTGMNKDAIKQTDNHLNDAWNKIFEVENIAINASTSAKSANQKFNNIKGIKYIDGRAYYCIERSGADTWIPFKDDLYIEELNFYAQSTFGAQSAAGSNGSAKSNYSVSFNISGYRTMSVKSGSATAKLSGGGKTAKTFTASGNGTYDVSEYTNIELSGSVTHPTEYHSESWGGGSFEDTYSIKGIKFTT